MAEDLQALENKIILYYYKLGWYDGLIKQNNPLYKVNQLYKKAYYLGKHNFLLDETDSLPSEFLNPEIIIQTVKNNG